MTVADHGSVARRALPYAVSLLALAAAAGCTAGSPPSAPSSAALTAPATTTSKAPTPTATATPSVDPVIAKIPAAARPETEQGASAFARFYFDSLNQAAINADPKVLEGLFATTCKTCVAMHDSVADLERAGQHHDGPTIRVVKVSTESFVPEKRVLLVDVDQTSVNVVDRAGKRVDRTIAAKGAFAVTLSFDRGHWSVARLQTVAA